MISPAIWLLNSHVGGRSAMCVCALTCVLYKCIMHVNTACCHHLIVAVLSKYEHRKCLFCCLHVTRLSQYANHTAWLLFLLYPLSYNHRYIQIYVCFLFENINITHLCCKCVSHRRYIHELNVLYK